MNEPRNEIRRHIQKIIPSPCFQEKTLSPRWPYTAQTAPEPAAGSSLAASTRKSHDQKLAKDWALISQSVLRDCQFAPTTWTEHFKGIGTSFMHVRNKQFMRVMLHDVMQCCARKPKTLSKSILSVLFGLSLPPCSPTPKNKGEGT